MLTDLENHYIIKNTCYILDFVCVCALTLTSKLFHISMEHNLVFLLFIVCKRQSDILGAFDIFRYCL